MKCGESIFPKEKRWGDTWQKEGKERPQDVKWTLMKITTLGGSPSLMVEFGSVSGVSGYEVPPGGSDILECVVLRWGWDPSQHHHPPVAGCDVLLPIWEGMVDGAGTWWLLQQPWLDGTEMSQEVGCPHSPCTILPPQLFPMYPILFLPNKLLIAG